MSEENVELSRRFIEAFNARDVQAMIALVDPNGKFHPLFAATVGGVTVYRGHDGLRRWHRDFEDAWGDGIRIEPEAYFDLGEQTLIFYVVRGRGRQSGAEVAMPLALVATWRDGLNVYAKVFDYRVDALSELGVSVNVL